MKQIQRELEQSDPYIFVLCEKYERGVMVPFVCLWSQGYVRMEMLAEEYPGKSVVIPCQPWESAKREAERHFGINKPVI